MMDTVTLYFDGLCHLCSREIGHYRKARGADRITFVDIAGPDFNPEAHGIDRDAVHRTVHVRAADGTIRTGVDAFLAFWDALPGYRWLAWTVRRPVIRQLAALGYAVFRRVRPWLPRRRRRACAGGTCPR